MRVALLVVVVTLAGCEDDRRASRRDRYDDDSRSYGGLRSDVRMNDRDRDNMMRKLDDDLLGLKKQVASASTGAWECDELVRLTNCGWDKYGTAVPASARQSFDDGVEAWRDALQYSSTRQSTIDACKAALDAAKPAFDAVGCY